MISIHASSSCVAQYCPYWRVLLAGVFALLHHVARARKEIHVDRSGVRVATWSALKQLKQLWVVKPCMWHMVAPDKATIEAFVAPSRNEVESQEEETMFPSLDATYVMTRMPFSEVVAQLKARMQWWCESRAHAKKVHVDKRGSTSVQ